MRSLRWKLMLMTTVLVFVPVYFLNRYAVTEFDRFTRQNWEDQLIDIAVMVGELYRATPDGGAAHGDLRPETFRTFCDTFSHETVTRIRVLSAEGMVRYDSDEDTIGGDDLSASPEVAVALQGFYKARWELTPDEQFVFYHCAQPVQRDGRVVGVVLVSRHTGPIIGAILRMYGRQRLVTVLALIFSALVAAMLSWTLTRRLRQLTRAASAFARGEASLPVRVRGRDEIADLARTFNRMADEIEKRQAYNRDFVATTFHELRTPITAIRGAAEILEQGAAMKPEAREKFLANIRHQADRLVRLVGELNELTRVDVEASRVPRETVDYPAALREILERLEPVFDEERAGLIVELPDDALPVCVAVPRIEQVIANFLENAFRYTPPDGTVRVRVSEGPGHTVVTSVADSGSGIAATNLDRVFDRFFTTEPKDAFRGYGSGLGLAIAQLIIENHQGTIRVVSEEGRGAEFIFTLPLGR